MTVTDNRSRFRQRFENTLAVAIALSLIIHLALFGTWRLGQKLGWWRQHPTWLVKFTQKLTSSKPRPLQARQQPPPNPRQDIPITFLEVDPATAVERPPENAKYYSTKNTVASNPDPDTKPVPKVEGQQDKVVRVMDNEKPLPFPLQPSPPKPVEPAPAPKPAEPVEKPGDIAFNKPANTINTNTAAHERPRTLAQAQALQKPKLAGERIKQTGGAENRGRVAFDAKATPFGDYDLAFISAVETRWHYLIDNNLVTPRAGRVVCEFKLTYDGRITDMKVENNEVGEILGMFCRNAIEDNQRYPKWPDEMRRTINANSREIRFTFYYN